jgi:hypothetical protein
VAPPLEGLPPVSAPRAVAAAGLAAGGRVLAATESEEHQAPGNAGSAGNTGSTTGATEVVPVTVGRREPKRP